MSLKMSFHPIGVLVHPKKRQRQIPAKDKTPGQTFPIHYFTNS